MTEETYIQLQYRQIFNSNIFIVHRLHVHASVLLFIDCYCCQAGDPIYDAHWLRLIEGMSICALELLSKIL